MIAVSISEHGAVSHTPVIPKIAGKTSVNPKRKTIPLNVEMIADDPASPQLVKYIEFTTLYPITRNVTA